MSTLRLIRGLGLGLALATFAACAGPEGPEGDPGPTGPPGSPAPTAPLPAGDTFTLTLTSAYVGGASGTTLFIEFTLTDDEGNPRSREDLQINWTAAVLRNDPVTGKPAWSSYFTRFVESDITGASTNQPTSDASGSYTDFGGGQYRYEFSSTLPESFLDAKTHRVAAYARREDPTLIEGYEVENDWMDFVPNGNPVAETREVVRTENCNTCHNPLQAHGTARRAVELCVTCHNPDLYDPDTFDPYDSTAGNMNPLDLKVLVHRIHQGKELPSVVAAQTANISDYIYSVIGYQGNEFIFGRTLPDNTDAGTLPQVGGVAYPRDQQDCVTCHTGGTESERHKTTVTREACSSCHDTVWFGDPGATPPRMENHAPGAYADDSLCATCHVPTMVAEFDISIPGAHVVPSKSTAMPGLDYHIVSVALVGSKINLVFGVHNGDGTPVPALASLSSINAVVNGPTEDYSLANFFRTDLKPGSVSTYDPGSETYTAILPQRSASDLYFPSGNVVTDDQGTWAIGLEARRTISVPGYGNVTEGNLNPVAYFRVDGSADDPVRRRNIVDIESCNVCHDRLNLHGGQRRETDYCVLCHTPDNTDWTRRPKSGGDVNLAATEDGIEERSIDFRTMIHKIHTGEELDESRPYFIYGFGGTPYQFDEVLFPGARNQCLTCHEDEADGAVATYLIESVPETARRVMANETATILHAMTMKHGAGEPTIPPIQAACRACHDSTGARVHSELNTNGEGEEACIVCHGEDREFSVRDVHRVVPQE